ncbi:MAG TPA: hypothetical protein ENK08_01930 [Chloroflexi bacterium]|nr:hypothetical protein [Chloroflexota bacterium]
MLPVDPSSTGTLVLGGIAIGLLGLMLLRLGRALGVLLIVLGVMVFLGLLAVALLQQSKATAATATAATVATAGQAASGVAVTVLAVLLVIVILGGGGVVGYLYLRLRRAERRGRWLPDPNARWGRAGEMPPVPWWMYPPLPPVWWRYPPPMEMGRGYGEPPIIVVDDEEGPGLDALPWEEEWGW